MGTHNLPLNGTRTHPLSKHALGVLRDLDAGTVLSYLINPGVRDRLRREDLAEEFEDVTGQRRYRITDAGRAALRLASPTAEGGERGH